MYPVRGRCYSNRRMTFDETHCETTSGLVEVWQELPGSSLKAGKAVHTNK
jgi:hypothetical protein